MSDPSSPTPDDPLGAVDPPTPDDGPPGDDGPLDDDGPIPTDGPPGDGPPSPDGPTPADGLPGDRPPSSGPPTPGDPVGDDHLAAFDEEFERVTMDRRWPLLVVGLLVIVALVASMVLVRSASSGDDPSDGGTVAPTTEPEPATEAEIEAAVDELSGFVEKERGLDFLEPVTVELEDEGDFQDRLLADFDEDADDLRDTEVFLQALGLVEPDVDLVEAMRSLLGGGVVGFYDPTTQEMVVRGAALTPYVRSTIAHELVHALDDQHHGLERPEYDDADDEVSFGLSAVAEGNARRIENAYMASLSEDERRQAAEEELSYGAGIDLGAVPLVLIDLISAPYSLGERFVDHVIDEGGDEALAAAFDDPPRTSEQVMDPDRYLEGEEAIDVPRPDVPGEVVEEGHVGQLLVLLVLADELGIDEARDAATGWGGDWGVAWRDGDRSCVTATFVGDDVAETEEMRRAFDQWASANDGAEVEATGGGGPFTLESCAG